MRRPLTVAAIALVVGQPLGPLSFALPGRTRAGLTAIFGAVVVVVGGGVAGGVVVGGSLGGGGEVFRVLVNRHSHASPLATCRLPSLSRSLPCALSLQTSVEVYLARSVAVPAASATVCVPSVTATAPVVPPSPTLVALAAPSTNRLNLPVSPAGATTFFTTLMVPVSRVLVTQHFVHSYQSSLKVILLVAASKVVSGSRPELCEGSGPQPVLVPLWRQNTPGSV